MRSCSTFGITQPHPTGTLSDMARSPMDSVFVSSCLSMKWDPRYCCSKTTFIIREVSRARSDLGHRNRRPLPVETSRRLMNHIRFRGRALYQSISVGRMMRNNLLNIGCNLDTSWPPAARSTQRLHPIRFHRIAPSPHFPCCMDNHIHRGICFAKPPTETVADGRRWPLRVTAKRKETALERAATVARLSDRSLRQGGVTRALQNRTHR
jgi:hypothetical protein